MEALESLSAEYRALVETANLDWLVAEYVRAERKLTEHSANEVKCAAIRFVAEREYGAAEFDAAVEAY
jgi:hypothetical protein